MKTLDQFNAERRASYEISTTAGVHIDIACPKCSAELMDTFPKVTTWSVDDSDGLRIPYRNVHCPSCGFKGLRIA